jgi:hypothetical protein
VFLKDLFEGTTGLEGGGETGLEGGGETGFIGGGETGFETCIGTGELDIDFGICDVT